MAHRFSYNWQEGGKYRIPPCCRLHYCLGEAVTPHKMQARQRGILFRGWPSDCYVPCAYHMRKAPRKTLCVSYLEAESLPFSVVRLRVLNATRRAMD